MLLFKTIFALFIPTLAGYALTILLFKKNRPPQFLSISMAYGLGLGALSLWMLLLSWMNIRLDIVVIGLPLFILSMGIIYVDQKRNITQIKNNGLNSESSRIHIDAGTLLLCAFILLMIVYIIWTALSLPVHTWDEIERVAFKAKFFAFDRSLNSLSTLPHPSYPLLIELSTTWLAMNLTIWNDHVIKIIIPLFFLSFCVIQFYFIKTLINHKWALASIALLMMAPLLIHHTTILYADLPLMYYNCSALMLILMWDIKKEKSFLISAAVFAGLASFTKQEGMAYISIHIILIFALLRGYQNISFRKKIGYIISFLIPCLSIFLFYFFYKVTHHLFLSERMLIDFSPQELSRILVVFEAFVTNLFLSGNWGIIWLVLLLSLTHLNKAANQKQIRLLFMCLFLYLGILFLQFVFTTNYFWISNDKAYGVLARLILQFYPIAPMLIILMNKPIKSE